MTQSPRVLLVAEHASARGDRYYETVAHCGRAQALTVLGRPDLARIALDDANRAAQAAGSLELQMMVEGARAR